MTKNQPETISKISSQMTASAATWEKIHRIAREGGTCRLTADDVANLAEWGSIATLLAQTVTAIDAEAAATADCIQEKIKWHNADLRQPDTERPVWIQDERGNVAQGWFNQIMGFWQARYPNAMFNRPRHWAEITGPAGVPPLNSCRPDSIS